MSLSSSAKPRVLYIVYWGAAEPLGQSLVLPAIRKLADLGVELTLVTFEKESDLACREKIADIHASLDRRGVEWIPLRYHKRPKIPATAFDVFQGIAVSLARRLRFQPDIIHARTFIGGLIGLQLAPLMMARLIYHNEGFYPDEQVDGGVWGEGSLPHRVARWIERRMYARADGIISMSHRGKVVIDNLPSVKRKRTPVIVVPSCVDLDLFRFDPTRSPIPKEPLSLVYSGSVGGRYILDKVGRFVAVAGKETGPARLHVLTRAEPELVSSMLESGAAPDSLWSMDAAPYTAMPDRLSRHHAGLFFLSRGLSEHGCSPTKVGEYWAMGLPVVTTPNVSDIDEIIRRYRVGVVVREHSDTAYKQAAIELRTLLEDPELPRRCRAAAEFHYALTPACERQVNLYNTVMSSGQMAAKSNLSESGNV